MRPQQRTEMNSMRPESHENSVEYILGEDDKDFDSDCENADESATSDSENDASARSKPANLCKDEPESDSDSSSTDCSTDTFDSLDPKNTPAALPNAKSLVCSVCGRGPYKSLKLHLLHCSGVRVKYQCSLCKKLFPTELSLNEHYMPLYSCDVCGQVYSQENLYIRHQCPKDAKSSVVYFCSETIPKVCNICKSFFTCEKTLLNHVTIAHTSVVSTKVCILTNSSGLTDKNVSPGVHGTARSVISNGNLVKQVLNGKLDVGQTYAGSLSTNAKSSPFSFLAPSSHLGSPSASTCEPSAAIFKSQNNRVVHQINNQPPRDPSASLSGHTGAANTIPDSVSSEQVSPPMPTIMAMFENDSHDVALMKRMNTGWRFKTQYPCRQCGAIFRQPSLVISHRYLHRGRRSHKCQCGRAFKHRLHLLRHCVQHAEAVSYICVSCGETFTGASLLAEHIQGKSRKKSRSGSTWKHKVKTKCKMPFTCDCGQLFLRPSAYIWHQLKNWKKPKQMK